MKGGRRDRKRNQAGGGKRGKEIAVIWRITGKPWKAHV